MRKSAKIVIISAVCAALLTTAGVGFWKVASQNRDLERRLAEMQSSLNAQQSQLSSSVSSHESPIPAENTGLSVTVLSVDMAMRTANIKISFSIENCPTDAVVKLYTGGKERAQAQWNEGKFIAYATVLLERSSEISYQVEGQAESRRLLMDINPRDEMEKRFQNILTLQQSVSDTGKEMVGAYFLIRNVISDETAPLNGRVLTLDACKAELFVDGTLKNTMDLISYRTGNYDEEKYEVPKNGGARLPFQFNAGEISKLPSSPFEVPYEGEGHVYKLVVTAVDGLGLEYQFETTL